MVYLLCLVHIWLHATKLTAVNYKTSNYITSNISKFYATKTPVFCGAMYKDYLSILNVSVESEAIKHSVMKAMYIYMMKDKKREI